MNSAILLPAIVLGILGAGVGIMLSIAHKAFYVETPELQKKIREALPGANCGACGYPGCDGLAEAIYKGEAPINKCPVGGEKSAKAIGNLIGVEVKPMQETKLLFFCSGERDKANKRFDYKGVEDCATRAILWGGDLMCPYGCLGGGTCVKACPFGALSMGENGLPVIDDLKCTRCGICVEVCPKHLFALVPKNTKVIVACSAKDLSGRDTRKVCTAGCIKCGMCARVCPVNAIRMEN
ncbi:MAG: RnfABCDGE type electron transport complex subunit B, partial [bacterium]